MFVSVQIDSARKCGRCGELKPASDFAWRRKARGQLDNYCRACRAAYKREHYMVYHELLSERGSHAPSSLNG